MGRFRKYAVARRAPSVRYRRAGALAKRGTSAVAKRAAQEKHTLIAVAGAAALGYAKREGMKLPTLGPLSPAASVGLIAWGIAKFTKSNIAAHAATGALCVAAHEWLAAPKGSASLQGEAYLEGDLEGDEDMVMGTELEG